MVTVSTFEEFETLFNKAISTIIRIMIVLTLPAVIILMENNLFVFMVFAG